MGTGPELDKSDSPNTASDTAKSYRSDGAAEPERARSGLINEETKSILRVRFGDGFAQHLARTSGGYCVQDGDRFRHVLETYRATPDAKPWSRFVLKPIIRDEPLIKSDDATVVLLEMELVVVLPTENADPRELLRLTVMAWLQQQDWTEETRPSFHEVVNLCRRDLGITKRTAERILPTIEGFGQRPVGRRRKPKTTCSPCGKSV